MDKSINTEDVVADCVAQKIRANKVPLLLGLTISTAGIISTMTRPMSRIIWPIGLISFW